MHTRDYENQRWDPDHVSENVICRQARFHVCTFPGDKWGSGMREFFWMSLMGYRCLNLHTLYLNLMDSVSVRCVEVSSSTISLIIHSSVFLGFSWCFDYPVFSFLTLTCCTSICRGVLGYFIRSNFSVSFKGLLLWFCNFCLHWNSAVEPNICKLL